MKQYLSEKISSTDYYCFTPRET